MLLRCSLGSLASVASLTLSLAAAQAHDESKYPNWSSQWSYMSQFDEHGYPRQK